MKLRRGAQNLYSLGGTRMNDLRFEWGIIGFRGLLNLDTPMDSTIELEILGILEFELGSN